MKSFQVDVFGRLGCRRVGRSQSEVRTPVDLEFVLSVDLAVFEATAVGQPDGDGLQDGRPAKSDDRLAASLAAHILFNAPVLQTSQ